MSRGGGGEPFLTFLELLLGKRRGFSFSPFAKEFSMTKLLSWRRKMDREEGLVMHVCVVLDVDGRGG